MARTAIAAGLVALSYDNATAATTQAADATNGNIVPFSTTNTPPTYGPFHVILAVTNGGGSAITCILRGSGYGGAASGAANSSLPNPANTVFTQGSLGDASFPVAAGTTQYIGPLSTDRFIQPNNVNGGDLWIDWSSGSSVTYSVILLPTNLV